MKEKRLSLYCFDVSEAEKASNLSDFVGFEISYEGLCYLMTELLN